MKKIYFILFTTVYFISNAAIAVDTSKLSADDPVCSEEVQMAVKYSASLAGNFIPYGIPGFIASGISGRCPSAMDLMSERIDQIDNRLDKVDISLTRLDARMDILQDKMNEAQERLDNLEFDILQVQNYTDSALVKTYIDNYVANLKKFDFYVSSYRTILQHKYSSFRDYSEHSVGEDGKVRGFKKLYNENGNFTKMMKSSAELVKLLYDIMPIRPNGERTILYLEELCRHTDSIPNDIVAQKSYCNRTIDDIMMNVAFRSMEARLILSDYIDTVKAAYDSHNIDDKWLETGTGKDLAFFNNDTTKKLKDSAEAAALITNKYLVEVRQTFVGTDNAKMFPLYDEFPKDKYDMIAQICKDDKGVPGIVEWWKTISAPDKEPYVIVNCPSNKDKTLMAQSKVYYTKITKLNNILGVLVDANATSLSTDNYYENGPSRPAKTYAVYVGGDTVGSNPPLSRIMFNLKSNVPLEINSVNATTFANGKAGAIFNPDRKPDIPDLTFVPTGQYYPINPVFNITHDSSLQGGEFVNFADMSNSKITQRILEPNINADNTVSNTVFKSEVYVPFSNLSELTFIYFSSIIYLSFKDSNNLTHVFGLKYNPASLFAPYSALRMSGSAKLSLVCLDEKDCSIVPELTIKWRDGHTVTLSNSYLGISINVK